jgi:hypothetical protein
MSRPLDDFWTTSGRLLDDFWTTFGQSEVCAVPDFAWGVALARDLLKVLMTRPLDRNRSNDHYRRSRRTWLQKRWKN